MGYDVHITRKAFWADEDGPEISLADWTRTIAVDPELHPVPILAPDGTILIDDSSPGSAAFVLPSGDWCPLWWFEGRISTKTPAPDSFTKLSDLATALGAQVQGDDGEVYDRSGSPVTPDPAPDLNRGFLKRLFSRNHR